MKVVINKCYGGFGLSNAAYERLHELGIPIQDYVKVAKGIENDGEVIFMQKDGSIFDGKYWDTWTINSRSHPLIIQVVEELGEEADGSFATLKIVNIPDGISWEIEEYDGMEWIAEEHETWS